MSNKIKTSQPQTISNFVVFKTDQGKINIDVVFRDDNLWLTQKLIAQLFGVNVRTVSEHLVNIFKSGELSKSSTIRKIRTVQNEGERKVSRELEYYNLDTIISVGYRVNSQRATQFRIWATKTLREFMIKGFVVDDERLKQGKHFGQDYFDELLEKIREIRSSERRFYRKITDIYALSTDYDKKSPITRNFFATVQNKLHWAITGKTAAEIVYSTVDASKDNLGLKTWKAAPEGKILKRDTKVAKNYLGKNHIKELEQIVSAYLDLAENRAKRKIIMNMKDWAKFINSFLELANYPILENKGSISKHKAEIKAAGEFERFRVVQDKTYESDFDIFSKKYLEKNN